MASTLNPYALLESDDEDRPVKIKAPKKPKHKKPKPVEKPKSKPKPKEEATPVENSSLKTKSIVNAKKSDGKSSNTDNFEPEPTIKENTHNDNKSGDSKKHASTKPKDKSGGSHDIKKKGAGEHNWGSTKDEIDDAIAESNLSNEQEPSDEKPVEEEAPTVEIKEIDHITYKEFQEKMAAERSAALEKLGPLKAKEVDASEFSAGKIKMKNPRSKEISASTTSAKVEPKKNSKTKEKKIFTEVGFTMAPIERAGRGRGRGNGFAGRGDQHRNGSQHSNMAAAAPSIDFTESSFPKLKDKKGKA